MTNIFSASTSEDINKGSQTSRRKSIFDFRKRMQKYRKSEDGSILVFALFTIILMMLIGGLAIDVMRAERQRTKIQYTGDRATLAAASLKQTESAQDIFDDYFAKDGIGQFTPRAVSINGLNSRRVTAVYDEGNKPSIRTFFIDTLGINELATPASSAAKDIIGKVEISLVLDISSSMTNTSQSGQTKIRDLQDAAIEFVDTLLLEAADDHEYSISIVPYATQVTAGELFLSKFTVSDEHNVSQCVDFIDDDYDTTQIDPVVELQRTGNFAPRSGSSTRIVRDNYKACYSDPRRQILPLSGNLDELTTYINALVYGYGTSTEIGMKWGAALLDPSLRPVIDDLIAPNPPVYNDDGELAPNPDYPIDAKYSGRPYDYGIEDVMKVMVVMTDGANSYNSTINPAVNTDAFSPVWHEVEDFNSASDPRDNDEFFWVYNPNKSGSKKYYRLYFKKSSSNSSHSSSDRKRKWVSQPPASATRMTYKELWNHATMKFVSRSLFQRANLDIPDWHKNGWTGYFSKEGGWAKDQRMFAMCDAAKANNILLFTIGFEVSNSNAVKLSSCATTPAHFFRVEGVEISDAFASIAAQLNNLRLIQ